MFSLFKPKIYSDSDNTNTKECIICLQNLNKINSINTPCSDCINIYYHEECLLNYFNRGNVNCCQCRKNFTENTIQSINQLNQHNRFNLFLNNNNRIVPININIHNNIILNNTNIEEGLNIQRETNNNNNNTQPINLFSRFSVIGFDNNENNNDPEQDKDKLLFKFYSKCLVHLIIIDFISLFFYFFVQKKNDLNGIICTIISFTCTTISISIKYPEHIQRYYTSFNEHMIFFFSLIQWMTRFALCAFFYQNNFDTKFIGTFVQFLNFCIIISLLIIKTITLQYC